MAAPPRPTPADSWSVNLDRRRRRARERPYQPLAPVAAAVALGVIADRVASSGLWWWLLAVGLWGLWAIMRRQARNGAATAALLLAVASTGAAWHHAHWRLFDAADVGRNATPSSAPICLQATALDAPRHRAAPEPTPLRAIPQTEKSVLRLRVTSVRDQAEWRAAAGVVELIVDGNLLGVHAGDRLRVFGQFRAPGEPLNPGQFDFAADARAERRLATLRAESPDCVQLQTAGPFSPRRWLTDTRVAIERRLNVRLGSRRGALAAAMLVGAREGTPPALSETFRRGGALHVLVISGLHVGLVVGAFYAAARIGWFPRRPTLLLIMGMILLYALLVGARPPVVRAAVLAEVMCVAALLGRRVLALNSLAAATLVVLALNPAELFRSGAQLSFLAAATLIWFGNRQLQRSPSPIERLIESARPWHSRAARWVVHSAALIVVATLVVWVTAAPLLACRFHLLSPLAIPTSVAVFPLVAVAVVSGLMLVAVDFLAPALADPVAGCCGASLDALTAVVTASAEGPGGCVWLAGPAGWWTIGVYVLLAAAVFCGHRPRMPVRLIQLSLAWVIVGALAAWTADTRPQGLRCSFLAVGHGCSVLIETPSGAAILYDAGSLSSPDSIAESIADVLWSKGISRLDAIVLSHADVDHFNAVPGLIERFGVDGVYVSDAMFPDAADAQSSTAPSVLRDALNGRRVPTHVLRQGDRFSVDEVSFWVLHPIDADIGGSDNAKSLVVGVEHAGRRVLLPGDLEAPGLNDLLSQRPYHCDVLLAPHHGSLRSDPPGFAAWSQPDWVVISGAEGPNERTAGDTYAAAGANVMRTSQQGLVELSLTRATVRATTFRGRNR